MMFLGSLGAATGAFMLVTTLMPLGQGLALVLVGFGMAAIAAFIAYRLARFALGALHAQSPVAGQVIAHALVWAIPIYMLLEYLGLA
jgi:hypothetical protein